MVEVVFSDEGTQRALCQSKKVPQNGEHQSSRNHVFGLPEANAKVEFKRQTPTWGEPKLLGLGKMVGPFLLSRNGTFLLGRDQYVLYSWCLVGSTVADPQWLDNQSNPLQCDQTSSGRCNQSPQHSCILFFMCAQKPRHYAPSPAK